MAWAEERNKNWRIVFRYQNAKHSFSVGEVNKTVAKTFENTTEELLGLLKRKMITLPEGCNIEEFMLHRGQPPASATILHDVNAELTLIGLREAYIASQEGKLEETTLSAIRLHFGHLVRIMGGNQLIAALKRSHVQSYADTRANEWIDPNIYRKMRRVRDAAKKPRSNRKPPPAASDDRPRRHPSAATIRKEIVSFRTAWNWARNQLDLKGEFPGRAIGYAKTDESLPFMTWDEAERRINNGDDPLKVWECVYLRSAEIGEFLSWLKGRADKPMGLPDVLFCVAYWYPAVGDRSSNACGFRLEC